MIKLRKEKTMANINVKIKEFTNATQGDLLGFNGKEWVPVSVKHIINDLLKEVESLRAETDSLKLMVKATKETLQKELTEQRQSIVEILKGIK